jgi:hypothetical protein
MTPRPVCALTLLMTKGLEKPKGPFSPPPSLIAGGGTTVNGEPLLTLAKTVTITFPVVAPVGTTATMLVALQSVTDVASVPLNVSVLDPCVAPKFVPAMVIETLTAPESC